LFVRIAENFQVMPLSGFLLSKILDLPSHYGAGLILVGCCPGSIDFNKMIYAFLSILYLFYVVFAWSLLLSLLQAQQVILLHILHRILVLETVTQINDF